MLHVVLVEPEIPANTGNIARTCAATGSVLHLVKPLGFDISDKAVKRAGLDYWNELNVCYYDSFAEVEQANPDARFFLLSTHANKSYADVEYRDGDFLVFGKETAGLGQALLARRAEDAVRIPMREGLRSLNLSNSVAILAYEVMRQHAFRGLTASSDYFAEN